MFSILKEALLYRLANAKDAANKEDDKIRREFWRGYESAIKGVIELVEPIERVEL